MSISIGTFNILDPDFAFKHKQKEGLDENNKSNWPTRKKGIIRLIKDSGLDVISLQEVSRQSLKSMRVDLNKYGYEVVYVKHSNRTDGLAILYKKDKLKRLKNTGSHTLSNHGLNSLYIDFQDSTSNKIVRVANCHLLGGPKSDLGSQQLEALIKKVAQSSANYSLDASIITGDFNTDETQLYSSPKFNALRKANYNFDGNLTPTEPNKKRHIDWIWVRASAVLNSLCILQPSVPVSDHVLLATQINFNVTALSPNCPPTQQPPTNSMAFFLDKILTIGQKIKSFFQEIGNFFAKLLGVS